MDAVSLRILLFHGKRFAIAHPGGWDFGTYGDQVSKIKLSHACVSVRRLLLMRDTPPHTRQGYGFWTWANFYPD
jgi:hypothetical protein